MALTEAEERVRATVDTLMGYRGLTGRRVAAMIGTSTQTVNNKRGGERRITIDDLEWLSEVLEVPKHVLLMEAPDALRWAMDNTPSRQAGFATVGSALAGTLVLITGFAAGHGAAPVAMLVGSIAENVCDVEVMSGDALAVAA